MATAELIRDESLSTTHCASPLVEAVIQGSTQTFCTPSNSLHSPRPVFFSPPYVAGGQMSIWAPLRLKTIAGFFYSSFFQPPAIENILVTRSSLQWDRLGLDLMRIADLKVNWDGEGADAIPPEAVKNAGYLLAIAKAVAENSPFPIASSPVLSPSLEGGVGMTWTHELREVKCMVLSDVVEVIRWRSPDRFESDGFWELPVQRVVEHFEWLLQR